MSIFQDTLTLFTREMLIFKKNIGQSIARGLIFPIVFIILLGSFGSTPKNVPVAIVNYDNGPAAFKFINLMQLGNNVEVISSTTQTQAMALLSQGSVAGVVVIPAGLSLGVESNIYVYLDNSQPQSSSVVGSVVNSVAAKLGIN